MITYSIIIDIYCLDDGPDNVLIMVCLLCRSDDHSELNSHTLLTYYVIFKDDYSEHSFSVLPYLLCSTLSDVLIKLIS